jgi:hypothetical protein
LAALEETSMFRVENADFIADKLAAELLPNQEFREVLKNAIEAIERRVILEGSEAGGRIEFDVDWSLRERTGRWYIACSDNGDGMSRRELERYMTTLAVEGAGRNQSLAGNQGMGLKISGPTRHKKGVLIRSLKDGSGTMVQIGWDGTEYGLIPVSANDDLVLTVPEELFPPFIKSMGSGTVVTFLGSTDDANTFVPPGNPRGWLLKYLNTRFFRLSNDGKEVVVRVPSGDEEDWPSTADEARGRMRGEGRSFNLTQIRGTAPIWDNASDRLGEGWRGVTELPGNVPDGVPPARMHWWVLPGGTGTDVSSRTASGGAFAVLFQNELHDWKTGNQANPFFARLGVLFGKSRIAFVLEPMGGTISADFARAHVLVAGIPVVESDAWIQWADQFRGRIPDRIRQTMAEEQARLQEEDPDRVRRIRDRLQEVMRLLRPRRFKRAQQSNTRAAGPEVSGPGDGTGNVRERPTGSRNRTREGGGRGIGTVLSDFDDQDGAPATEVFSGSYLEPQWVTEEEADGMPIVNGNDNGIRDRAAALNGTDGRTAGILLLNRDFRGYQAILATLNDWANPEGDDAKVIRIEAITQEWVEQKMIEAVQGLRQLENGRTWITEHYDAALSPVALTAAFMADRYHTLREVRRAAGSLRQTARTA